MSTHKKGYISVTLFFITSFMLLCGLLVVKTTNMVYQEVYNHYNYWKTYYLYEKLLHYSIAVISHKQTNTTHTFSVYENGTLYSLYLVWICDTQFTLTIKNHSRTQAVWKVTGIKNSDDFTLIEQKLIIQNTSDF